MKTIPFSTLLKILTFILLLSCKKEECKTCHDETFYHGELMEVNPNTFSACGDTEIEYWSKHEVVLQQTSYGQPILIRKTICK